MDKEEHETWRPATPPTISCLRKMWKNKCHVLHSRRRVLKWGEQQGNAQHCWKTSQSKGNRERKRSPGSTIKGNKNRSARQVKQKDALSIMALAWMHVDTQYDYTGAVHPSIYSVVSLFWTREGTHKCSSSKLAACSRCAWGSCDQKGRLPALHHQKGDQKGHFQLLPCHSCNCFFHPLPKLPQASRPS